MPENSIKAVIFDMGGVFVQTKNKKPRQQLAQHYNVTYDELSQIVFDSETAQLATVGKIEEQEHWLAVSKALNIPFEEMDEFWIKFWSGDELDIQLVDYAKSLKGKYQIALLSNAWGGARDLLTSKYGFLDIFDVSIFSAEAKMAKPDEKFYLWMTAKLKIQPFEAIFVDDFFENIAPAEKLGMQTVHFLNTRQAIEEIQATLKT